MKKKIFIGLILFSAALISIYYLNTTHSNFSQLKKNPDKILTHGLTNSVELMQVLRYITMNLKHFTSYKMFANFTTKEITKYRKNTGFYKKQSNNLEDDDNLESINISNTPTTKNTQDIQNKKKDNLKNDHNETYASADSSYSVDSDSDCSNISDYKSSSKGKKLRPLAKKNTKKNPNKNNNYNENQDSSFAYFMNSTFFS